MTKDRTPIVPTRRLTRRTPSTSLASTLGLLLASALLVPAANAQPRERGSFFERLDTNGDGVVDGDELLTARREAFERADKDGDGFVSGSEVDALVGDRGDTMRPPRRGLGGGLARRRMPDGDERVRRLDTDGDGRISETEFLETRNPLLDRFDANGDGAISRDEIDRAQERMRGQARRRGVL